MYFSLFLEGDWFITNVGYDCAFHLRDETLSGLQSENKNGATQLMVQKPTENFFVFTASISLAAIHKFKHKCKAG